MILTTLNTKYCINDNDILSIEVKSPYKNREIMIIDNKGAVTRILIHEDAYNELGIEAVILKTMQNIENRGKNANLDY
jgi:hypothetical protein